jgi:nucleotide-binding universal stress UspA family protein
MKTHAPALQRILVPLDGSTLAEEALATAVTLARRSGAEVHLVTVRRPVIPARAQFGIGEDGVPTPEGTGEDVECYHALMTARLARAHGVRVVTAILVGDPAKELAEYAEARAIQLVVMTTHGRGGFGRFWLGSVANRLVRLVEVPVLLRRHSARCADGGFERILVAVDGTPGAERALRRAIELGSLMPTTHYTLVRVVEPPSPLLTPIGAHPSFSDDQSLNRLMAAAANDLAIITGRMHDCGISVEAHVLVGDVADQLVAFSERCGSQLIAVGTRAARGLDRLILGSVADAVVKNAGQPVLVVPPKRSDRPSRARAAVSATAAFSQPTTRSCRHESV